MFFCLNFRMRSHLKEHLTTVHRWTPVQASCARVNFGLNMARPKLSDDSRKTKAKVYRYQRCPFSYCQREVARVGNHLRQFHKLTGVEYKHMMLSAEYVQTSVVGNTSGKNESLGKETPEVIATKTVGNDAEEAAGSGADCASSVVKNLLETDVAHSSQHTDGNHSWFVFMLFVFKNGRGTTFSQTFLVSLSFYLMGRTVTIY